MQVYAFDEKGFRVFAENAAKGSDYICMECGNRVRRRAGYKKRHHFFHLKAEKKCSQHRKSHTHIFLQALIVDQIQNGSGMLCTQEEPFTQISRIADVCWHEKQIVFEVQCSPISIEEIKKRTADYESIGWYVIWVLLDRTFLKRTNSFVVSFLQKRTHYYANYRQKQLFDYCRHFAESKELCHVNLSTISECKKPDNINVSGFFELRFTTWKYYAKQDLIWLKISYPNAYFLQKLERLYEQKSVQGFSFILALRSVWFFIVRLAYQTRCQAKGPQAKGFQDQS